jgi:hypothetical protein
MSLTPRKPDNNTQSSVSIRISVRKGKNCWRKCKTLGKTLPTSLLRKGNDCQTALNKAGFPYIFNEGVK